MGRLPLVSVVMPFYNAADTVEDAIRSLLSQSHQHLEILAVDDGSTDGSASIAGRIPDTRLRLLHRNHGGLVGALVHGCAQARGSYIARLDADDVAHEDRIAAQLGYLEQHRDVGLVGTWATIEQQDGARHTFAPPASDADLRRYLLWDNPFIHSSVMFRKEAYEQTGGYIDGPNEDYSLWIRMARTWKLAVLPTVLVVHRVRSTSMSRARARSAALRARLAGQWEAARRIGPWYSAIPALATTCAAYAFALLGGVPESRPREFLRATRDRMRGFQDAASDRADDPRR